MGVTGLRGARTLLVAAVAATVLVGGCGPFRADPGPVVGAIDSDLACTPTAMGADPVRVGLGVPDLPAMTLDPRTGLGLADRSGPSDYLDPESIFTLDAYSLSRAMGTDDQDLVCAALRDRGWVAGYERRLSEEESEEGAPVLVSVTTRAFQTETGARDFVAWLPTGPWRTAPTTEPIDGAGPGAVLLGSAEAGSQVRLAVVRSGPIVGEILVKAPAEWQADIDLAAAAAALVAQVDSVQPGGGGADLGQVLSAPLRSQDWSDAQPGSPEQAALATYWTTLRAFDGAQTPAPADGRVGSYDHRLANAAYLAPQQDGATEYPIVGTEVLVYPDADAAAAGLDRLVADGAHAPGGLWFDPGVPGAIGLRHWTEDQVGFEGYSWDVHMAVGPVVATAYVRRTSKDEAQWTRDRQWASSAAATLADRLSRVLGSAPQSPATPSPPADADDDDLALRPGPAATTLVAGSWLTCGLDAAGAAWCWGAGPGTRDASPAPVAVPGGLTFTTLDAMTHACALDGAGRAWCWGPDGAGALGDGPGSSGRRVTPVAVAGGLTYVDITTGQDFSCAVEGSGQAWCWGHGTPLGSLGDGTPGGSDTWVPVRVAGDHDFVAIEAGRDHACALTADGSAWCWGDHRFGQLGDGSDEGRRRTAPVRVEGGHSFTRLAAGERHTCALDTRGAAWCWGDGTEGALGDGSDAGPSRLMPHPVVGGHRFTSISAGMSHTCAVDADQGAWCWGRNSGTGMLGNGDTLLRDSYRPIAVEGGHSFPSVSAGVIHTCALDSEGAAWCWGDDQSGQLGQGPGRSPTCPTAGDGLPEEFGCSPSPLPVVGGIRFLRP